ncbi:putative small lipoprotein YifL [Paenibacillus anaericanus]|uniref:GerMN domain-containing protein n=1 Tax=Paenibacillus anaericanus TaxID=170367 RepID=UPI00278326E3|nr:GerMN domain-containing protein [Paenibacillus anaericanus]MDQ0088018.1 putative small lipoprotein YifL [Paenibacillus anaericanus]
MSKKYLVSGMLILLLVLSAGCGQKPQASPGNSQNNATDNATENSTNSTTNNGVSDPTTASPGNSQENQDKPADNSTTKTIDSYYTDDQMLELKKVSKDISYSSDTEKYEAALKTLQNSSSTELFALWEKVVFKSVKFENGELTVDITLPDEARLGAGGESLALDSLKQTLFQFSEVKSIELLVDGAQVESLMGHEELEHPMTRN